MARIKEGDVIERQVLESIDDKTIELPHPSRLTHLQFRRFAGCPMCNLHVRTFVERHDELVALGIQEIAVFHSSRKAMLAHHAEAPFALIADPTKSLYRKFGVASSVRAVLHPEAWLAATKGVLSGSFSLPEKGESPLGLPADFLIGTDGRVVACKFGTHAYDHWTVDELIAMAHAAEPA